jgi:membrane protein DedA with SNARE-associated domain
VVAAAAAALWCLVASPGPAQEVPPPATGSAKERLARLVEHVEPMLHRWGYPAIVGLVALDTAGIPTPAASLMVAGTLAADRRELRLVLVASLAFAATVAGSHLGYAIGRCGGRGLLARLPLARARLAKLEHGYRRWGALIVIAAPLSEGVRQLNGMTAGALGMAWPRFALANLLGSAVFVGLWVGGTWLLDEHYLATILPLVHGSRPWLIGAAALAVAGLVAWLWRRGRDRLTPARTSG